ncbi:Spx/MgsR family RNA polymerase-binding regulatory protein [Mesobacillus sp. AQ2]|uniref:Spx/MgsR family RNA polymerase-binding regulatory protein n=1 Tax=Bacillaceae TaxID=186817 RepID=UPI0011A4830F|nr:MULTISPECIES: Spx/MgsR family RNA polymerase-binding regulatory protein [Bacillaceae]MCM3122389.1 Spx/MgsR family RNA polymerase-binding regulatory protein [Mesobacillus sp. MER 33]MCM3232353.1 Spx/MgsR family RNA polymerase-binding regulatory protein [Mesobacillus sp. MER 48]WHX39293.1 Spx/MgsR family RNA polymerase-binding regulatory protein [Mesobacillus sp. AQ2]
MEELTFFSYPSCTSCRKTKKWLISNSVKFNERHLFKDTPNQKELMEILTLTTEGVDELLATRGETFKNLKLNVDELSLSEVINLVIEEPKLLRRPILTDGKKLIVGFNPDALKKIAK